MNDIVNRDYDMLVQNPSQTGTFYQIEWRTNNEVPIGGINLEKLKIFVCQYGIITNLEALRNASVLKEICANHNLIYDLRAFSTFKNLSKLDLHGNKIKDISPLANCKALVEINLSKNMISDITPLKNLPKVRCLKIGSNKIKSLEALKNFKFLEELYAPNNAIKQIDELQNLNNLIKLVVKRNLLTDVGVISLLPEIRSVNFENNGVERLAGGKKLVVVKCSNNFIKSLQPLRDCFRLRELYCDFNYLTSVTEFISDLPILEISSFVGNKGENSLKNEIEEIKELQSRRIERSVIERVSSRKSSRKSSVKQLVIEDRQSAIPKSEDLSVMKEDPVLQLLLLNNIKELYRQYSKYPEEDFMNEILQSELSDEVKTMLFESSKSTNTITVSLPDGEHELNFSQMLKLVWAKIKFGTAEQGPVKTLAEKIEFMNERMNPRETLNYYQLGRIYNLLKSIEGKREINMNTKRLRDLQNAAGKSDIDYSTWIEAEVQKYCH